MSKGKNQPERIRQCRESGVYEVWRDDFTRWLVDERRSVSWVTAKTGKSYHWVAVVMQVLRIYTRAPMEAHPDAIWPLPLRDRHRTDVSQRAQEANARRREPGRVAALARDLADWVKMEHEFQRMRLEHCSAWDRGW